MDGSRLYFRQLLAGRDFAADDQVAQQMVNFVYLVGDRRTAEAVVIDPAYAVGELVDIAAADGMRITDALATHYHVDHIGGSMMGLSIQGAVELLEAVPVRLHAQKTESEWITKSTELTTSDLVLHESGDTLEVGEIPVQLIHTPGHTPGSQCFLVEGYLVAGDTLFLEGCGRTDLPGADPAEMYQSLQRLAKLPGDTVLFPGHRYSFPSSATLDITLENNFVFKPRSEREWLTMFGGAG